MKLPTRIALADLALTLILAAVPRSSTAQIQIFSTGQYGTPETISLAPGGFGAFGGDYFIPDARTSGVWVVPNAGGPPAPFLAAPIEPVGNSIIGGLFLPSGWGANSGKFLVASSPFNLVIDSAGTVTAFDPQGGAFTMPLIVPAFGPYVGNLFVTDQNGIIWRADPAGGGLTSFADLRGGPFRGGPFGIEHTTPGFGLFGDRLMISDTFSGSIAAVAPNGTWNIFTNVPLDPGQSGLRQMLMAPDNYFLDSMGIPGELLLISVSGSDFGGGTLGAVLALDSSGTVKAHLKAGSTLQKFDPRGMVFTGDGHLLISDTSDPILFASARDFGAGLPCFPKATSSVSTPSLWPPNHDLVNVGLAATGTDTCLGSPTIRLAIYSNEDDLSANGGDGNFSPDAKNIRVSTLRLRAERNGNGDGRVYLIVVNAINAAGDFGVHCSTVVVPKSQSKKDQDAIRGRAEAAKAFCLANAGAPPPGYFVIGDDSVVGPKQ